MQPREGELRFLTDLAENTSTSLGEVPKESAMTSDSKARSPEQTEWLEKDPLNERLRFQLDRYIEALAGLNDRRGAERKRPDHERERELLDFTFAHFLMSRDQRIEEILDPEVQETIRKKQQLFPLGTPFLMACMDGRIFSKIFAGLHGNAYRTPAGDSRQFVPRAEDGQLFLQENSVVASMMDAAFTSQDDLSEVLDSHMACAARLKEEMHRQCTDDAGDLPDGGLLQDVLRKRQMATAMREYVAGKYGDTKRVYPIQTSYDVHDGYLVMGLEQCADDARVTAVQDPDSGVSTGFTSEILEALIAERKVISTRQLLIEELANGMRLDELFAKIDPDFDLDYETNYIESTVRFWKNIEAMQEEALPAVRARVRETFPTLSGEEHEEEVGQRALLLLANAYTAYLLHLKRYPYDEHDESVIVVTYSEKGPFDRVRSFSIDTGNPDIDEHIELAAGLVRKNRAKGSMSTIEQEKTRALYPRQTELKKAPVPLVKFERLSRQPSKQLLDALQQVDWSGLAMTPWLTEQPQQFRSRLIELLGKQLTLEEGDDVLETIEELRQRAIRTYSGSLRSDLFDGSIVPLFVLAGPDRKTIALLPFISSGVPTQQPEPVASTANGGRWTRLRKAG